MMKRSQVVVQPTLPGLAEGAVGKRPAGRHPATRVWQDPAVVESRAEADDRHADWRRSFVGFVAGLPARRRDELRRRLGLPRTARRRGSAAA
jgi:hypothetical protein